ncbi:MULTISPECIES: LexA family transcriptional regulator [Burkholderia]|uniref:LexA family transcriptional regulator n=1 Tax=Burkholderia TaxID=32008 RepID=UPI00055472E2|nr:MULTISPECIES: helix-turn-helix transcriptional regulator [Burkholderia]AOJ14813.1 repressor [Burkholderia vietnamiensis]TCT31920.1 helix-turn-helix protein [Burkholderia vietnamiensis]SCZ28265.1 Helix-turn-helix [Burkholderia vietnamiensis]SFX63903.1 Helix-turn-helix [Burkholderia vietnamiensis]HDR9256378.1 helix-turn-helix transcriptional regulator [Burkholderia vietnamiensis]
MDETEQSGRIEDGFPPLNLEIGRRIDEVCRAIGGREEAAKAAGVSAGMLRRYIRGESMPPLDVAMNLARAANRSVDWIAGACDQDGHSVTNKGSHSGVRDTLGNPVDLSEFVFIPRYSVKAAAGHGQAVTNEAPTHTMAFRRYWIEHYLRANPADLSVLSVRGDSQLGVLNDRDVILIDRSQTSGSAGLYVLRIDGEIIVKTLQRLPGGIIEVSSANPAYKTFEVDTTRLPDDFAIIGQVVWFGRQV